MERSWLLLLHQIPPSPAYFRARVLRRLQKLGALPIKNSAYLLPSNAETMEDMEWLRSEIVEKGGEAWVFEAATVAGLTDASLVSAFRELHAVDISQLLDKCRALRCNIESDGGDPSQFRADYRKLKKQLAEVAAIDYFHAAGRTEVEEALDTMGRLIDAARTTPVHKPKKDSLVGRTWVTRRSIKVDRIGTAWLIRRFIDPKATIKFVNPDGYKHADGELRFDMFEGEFTHEGDLCSFEVLLHHIGLRDPALSAIAEIVHDIDIKDDKYQRAETGGVAAQINGIAALYPSDDDRLENGSKIFEITYAGLKSSVPAGRSKRPRA